MTCTRNTIIASVLLCMAIAFITLSFYFIIYLPIDEKPNSILFLELRRPKLDHRQSIYQEIATRILSNEVPENLCNRFVQLLIDDRTSHPKMKLSFVTEDAIYELLHRRSTDKETRLLILEGMRSKIYIDIAVDPSASDQVMYFRFRGEPGIFTIPLGEFRFDLVRLSDIKIDGESVDYDIQYAIMDLIVFSGEWEMGWMEKAIPRPEFQSRQIQIDFLFQESIEPDLVVTHTASGFVSYDQNLIDEAREDRNTP